MRARNPKPPSMRGMSLTELMIGLSIFSIILTISFGLISHWMNISRLSDLQAEAVGEGRDAMVQMATDIRNSNLIFTNAKVKMKYPSGLVTVSDTPPTPFPAFSAYSASRIPLVVLDSSTATVSVGYEKFGPLKTNSIVLVTNNTELETKKYIVYYTGTYRYTDKGASIQAVGLFRYEWTDNSNAYKLNMAPSAKPVQLATISVDPTVTLGVATDPTPNPPSSKYTPVLTRTVPLLHYAHAPGYTKVGSKAEPHYLFSIYSLHPASQELWMSPFYVDIQLTVVAPKKSVSEIPLQDDKLVHSWTMRTVAFAKNVEMPMQEAK